MRISKAEIKYLRSLSQKKVRQAERKFVLEGWRGVKEVLNSSSKIESVAVLSRYLDDPDYLGIIGKLRERDIPIRELEENDLKQVADTVHAQGVVAVVAQRNHAIDDVRLKSMSLIVAADSVSDPGNLGSLVRSSDWFDADMVFLGRGCVDLYNDKVVRSTVGSIFHLPVVEGVDLPSMCVSLKRSGFTVVALSGDGKESYTDVRASQKVVYVFGSEAHGVSKEVRGAADAIVRIPKYGKAESLNVGVACGIVLAHARMRHGSVKGA